MTKFHVRDTFEIADRHLFVVAGNVVQGEIRTDMFIRIPLNSSHGIQLRIDSIEHATRQDGEDVRLCVQAGGEFAQILRGLKVAGETLEVTSEPSEPSKLPQ